MSIRPLYISVGCHPKKVGRGHFTLTSMKSKAVRFVVLTTVGELVAASAFAQKAANAADNAFIQLQAVALPIEPAPTPPGTKKTKEQFDNDRKLQSAGFLAAADKRSEEHTSE